jgi:DNA-binding transcriptional MerR regulator
MPTTAKENRATWLDWVPEGTPEPQLLSLPELLEALRDEHGIEITPYTLEHYRRQGVLPRPIRRRHGGVTQATYPVWFVSAIAHLKDMQRQGKSLAEIKPWMRAWALSTVQWADPFAKTTTDARAALTALVRAHGHHAGGVLRVAFVDDDGHEVWATDWPVPPNVDANNVS